MVLRRRVHVAGIDRRVLWHRLCEKCATATRASRLTLALLQPSRVTRADSYDAVISAAIPPLPVDDHAAPEDDSTAESALVQCREQHGGAEIIVGHVLDGVTEVDPESDHGGLMRHCVDTGGGDTRDRGIAEITPD